MAREVLEAGGISDLRVLESVRSTPRHEFVQPQQRSLAYVDMALPIGEAQTISGIFVVAYMTEQLQPAATDRVLEIGTGSGYQAAVLSPLVAEVYSIEIHEPLGRRAARTLQRLGYQNVFTKIGDGFAGWPEKAPFDKIIVTCSPEAVPQPLVEQLAEGGRMIIPVGTRYDQTLVLLTKRDGQLVQEALVPSLFVPMTGEAERTTAWCSQTGRGRASPMEASKSSCQIPRRPPPGITAGRSRRSSHPQPPTVHGCCGWRIAMPAGLPRSSKGFPSTAGKFAAWMCRFRCGPKTWFPGPHPRRSPRS